MESPAPESPNILVIPETGDRLIFKWTPSPGGTLDSRNAMRVFLAPDAITFPLTIRNTRPGDRFRPEGGNGSRKLGRFLADCAIEGPKRSQIPLVVSKEKILWVGGHRLDMGATAPLTGSPTLEIVLERHEKG